MAVLFFPLLLPKPVEEFREYENGYPHQSTNHSIAVVAPAYLHIEREQPILVRHRLPPSAQ